MLPGYRDALCSKEINKEKVELVSEFGFFFAFQQDLAIFWQHAGCLFLCQPNLTKVYHGLIDLNRGSKVLLGFLEEKLKTLCIYILVFFANFQIRFKIVPSRLRKWKTGHLTFKKINIPAK